MDDVTYQVRNKETDEALVERIHYGNPESQQVIALPWKNISKVTTVKASFCLCKQLSRA